MKRAEGLLVWLFAALALALLGDRVEERVEQRRLRQLQAPVVVPAQWPACPRLRPLAGRIDTIVIDHVLIYRCGRT